MSARAPSALTAPRSIPRGGRLHRQRARFGAPPLFVYGDRSRNHPSCALRRRSGLPHLRQVARRGLCDDRHLPVGDGCDGRQRRNAAHDGEFRPGPPHHHMGLHRLLHRRDHHDHDCGVVDDVARPQTVVSPLDAPVHHQVHPCRNVEDLRSVDLLPDSAGNRRRQPDALFAGDRA